MFFNPIPISKTGSPDKLIWHFDSKGQYTVKSGYQQAIAWRQNLNAADESSVSPSSNFWKINCDAAFKSSKAALGIVVSDSTIFPCYVHGDLSCAEFALYAEIIAIHSACLFASNHGWLNAIVESDSQMAISLSSSEAHPPWRFATLIDDIRLWAKNMHITFSWVKREQIKVAHWVASHAFSTTSRFSWDNTFPHEITSLAMSYLYVP
ncbi:reverse transcriptase [Tanacetum coccineum]